MTRAILVDAPPAALRADGSDAVITLSAEAELACVQRGVPHWTLTDVAPEQDLAAFEDRYWDQQVAWLDKLEERLVAASPTLRETGLRPIYSAGYQLKLLVDPVFVKAYECDRLTAGTWTELTHFPADAGGLHAALLPRFCSARGLRYEAIPPATETAAAERSHAPVPSLRARLVSATDAARRSLDVAAANGKRRRSGLVLLLTSSHYDLADLCRANRRNGGRVLLLDGDAVIDVSGLRAKVVATLPPATAAERDEWRTVAEAVIGDDAVTAWPRSWFEGHAEAIVLDRVARWIAAAMPDIAARARGFRDLFAQTPIDAVVAPYLADSPTIAAVAGARARGGPRTAVIEHGDTAFAAPSWDLQLLAAETFVATNTELAEYFRGRGKRYERPTADVAIGSYRWRRSAALTQRPRAGLVLREGRSAVQRRPTLVYVVTAAVGDMRYLNTAAYPDAWYFDLERTIVDALARHTRYRVVVKLFPNAGHAANPIGRYVDDLGLPHVRTSSAPFSSWLPWAERVLVDFPSTALYESLVAGVPTLGLLWRNHHLRPSAVEALGAAGAMFTTPAEAAEIVDAFASGPPPPVPPFHPEGPTILDTLTRLVRE